MSTEYITLLEVAAYLLLMDKRNIFLFFPYLTPPLLMLYVGCLSAGHLKTIRRNSWELKGI
jgi:hypothetical protein